MIQNKRSLVRYLKLVYGAPEPDYINNVESFGDLILQRLSNYGDRIGLVSNIYTYSLYI